MTTPTLRFLALASLLALGAACSKSQPADPAKARAVIDKVFQAEMEHRNSHGNFWRDRQAKVDRGESMKFIGVDVGEATGFDVFFDPAVDGMDTTLVVRAEAQGGGAKIRCSQKAGDPKPTCS